MIGYPSRRPARGGRAATAAVPGATITDAALEAPLGPRTLLLGGVLIAGAAAFVRPVTDPDYWMHLAVGRWILTHRRLPGHDLFTYTVPDHRWVAHEYLSEVLMWLLHAAFGPAGASLAFGVLTWLGLLLVLAAAGARRHPYPIVGAALALAILAGGPVWGPRPQMVTFFLVALELLWLRRFLEGSSRAILWLPAVMVAWSNLHGGWAAGFLFLGVAWLGEAVGWLGDRSAGRLAHLRGLTLVAGLSALAVMVNPNGPAIVLYPFQTLTSGAQQGLIQEWQSPNFHLLALQPAGAMVLLLLAGLALGRPGLHDLLLALTAVGLALLATRHLALLAAAATPVLVSTWSDAWRRLRAARPTHPAARPLQPRLMSAATAAALALVAAVVAAPTVRGLVQQPAVTRQIVPVVAADWLAAHPGVGTRMFNQYGWGGYLADRFYPDPNRRVYVFTEGVLMGDDLLLRYREVTALGPRWRQLLDEAGVDYVVIDRDSPLDDVLAGEPGWRRVYRDATASIYVRDRSGG